MLMNWENADVCSEEAPQNITLSMMNQNEETVPEQNERKRLDQLKKVQCYDNDENKKGYVTTITKFGELLLNHNTKEMLSSLLTEDCEAFLFNFAEICPARYALKPQEFVKLFEGYRVIQREITETYVDLEKGAAFQICDCQIKNEKDESSISQFSFETFSFRNGKIRKYRATFGCMTSLDDARGLFQPSRKEIMLAKVKEINYAWTQQPDIDKIASLLDKSTEYKIWRWNDKKVFTLNKDKFASDFLSLQEDYVIKSIVPFDPSCEAQYIIGSYVYYLEGKGELAGKKYQWMTTCIYAFDRDLNISKISQQGDLYPENEFPIPFEVNTKEKIKQKIDGIYAIGKHTNLSIFTSDEVNFSFELGIFSSSDSPLKGVIKGLSEYNKLAEILASKKGDFELSRPLECYIDLEDPSYDTVITVDCTKGITYHENYIHCGNPVNVFGMRKYSFENGKLAKSVVFLIVIPEGIPSPYDDESFMDLYIRPKHEFVKE